MSKTNLIGYSMIIAGLSFLLGGSVSLTREYIPLIGIPIAVIGVLMYEFKRR